MILVKINGNIYEFHIATSLLPFFFFGDTGDPSLAPPTPLYRCSESALPDELLDEWLLTEDTLLALEDREDPEEEDRLLDLDLLLLLGRLFCLAGLQMQMFTDNSSKSGYHKCHLRVYTFSHLY
jgi:hypothetical protein